MSEYPDQNFVEFVVKAICLKPDSVNVKRTVDEMGVLYMIDVDKEDMAKVIGKAGQTAKAIRQLLRIVGFNNRVRATMKINDPIIKAQ